MTPVDPRLLRHARASRPFLAAVVLLGLGGAGLVIAQAMLIAEIVVGAFQHGDSVGALRTPFLLLVAVAAGRGAVAWLTELAAHRASATVKAQLRAQLLARAAAGSPSGRPRTGELVTLACRGLDALDDYFARYLPQLGLAVVVPVAVLARVVSADWTAALTIVLTLPLIPVFMVLIGWATQARMDRQWHTLSRLSGHFLDVVAGLPTLRVFGRAQAQAKAIARITADYRRATLRTLRISFLSSFALELLATLSVALVAVGVGMRLVHGDLDLYTGLVVLILAPEAYLPLRQVGAQYHAAAEGLAAADQALTLLEEPLPPRGTTPAPDLTRTPVHLDEVVVQHPGRAAPSLPVTSLTLEPGETVALTGPSGSGKTTLLHALLGLTPLTAGRITVAGHPLDTLDPDTWHAQIAWVPQHPRIFAGTIADNVRLARPDATDTQLRAALAEAGLLTLVETLPYGTDTRLGEDGAGLSAGQRQRVALARAFLADRPVLLLDEPTAGLDAETEAAVVAAVRRLAVVRTVLLVAHRPALLAAADRTVTLPAPAVGDVAGGGKGAGGGVGGGGAGGPDVGERAGTGKGAGVAEPGLVPRSLTGQRGEDRAEPGEEVPGRSGSDLSQLGMSHVGPSDVGSSGLSVSGSRSGPSVASALSVPSERSGQVAPLGRTAPSGGGVPSGRHPAALRLPRLPRGRLLFAAVLGSLAVACAVGLMATSGYLISRASEQPPVLYLMVAVTATRAFGIGRAVFRYVERLVAHDATFRLLAELRVAVYRRLSRIAPGGLGQVRRGDLLSRLVADVDTLQDHFLRWLLPATAAVTVSVAAVGLTGWLLPEAGVVLAVGLLVAGALVPVLAVALARRTERRLAPARGDLSTAVVDLLTGTAELTVAGALPRALSTAREADAVLTRLAARSAATAALGAGLTALTTGLTVAGAAWTGVVAVGQGRLDGVTLAVVVLTALAAFEAVAPMALAAQHRQRTRRSLERINEVLTAPEPVVEPDQPLPLPAQPLPLRVRGLTAGYPGRSRPALAGVDLDLTAGRRVAVVGASGSGKTTLAQVLLRFVDVESGTVTLAGRLVRECAGDDVRRVVGLCAQDAHVFDSSLRENLRLARPDCTEADLWDALARARLADWVAGLPDGLDTMVGEHGARISGGQRQRLALARALLADFPVLVLDEPAEHLDLPTADALTADLLAATEGRTTVLITHRLAGLAAVDEILVLDAGRVVQRGTWAELADADGPLRRMRDREETADLALSGEPGDGAASVSPAGGPAPVRRTSLAAATR